MLVRCEPSEGAVPLWFVTKETWPKIKAGLPEAAQTFAMACGFEPAPGRSQILPNSEGRIHSVVLASSRRSARHTFLGFVGLPVRALQVQWRRAPKLCIPDGNRRRADREAPDGNSLFRLNSITKVFTTEVLASLAAEGKLALTDSLQRYAHAKVPAFGTRPITLLDLATHTAVLPREMGEAPPGVPARAWPTREDRWKWLAGYRHSWAPGTIAAYSNVSFDLLADAIETASGQSYPDLLRARVTAPLGMVDTGFTPMPDQCARLTIGSGLGGVSPCIDTHATDGSGGLYSLCVPPLCAIFNAHIELLRELPHKSSL